MIREDIHNIVFGRKIFYFGQTYVGSARNASNLRRIILAVLTLCPFYLNPSSYLMKIKVFTRSLFNSAKP